MHLFFVKESPHFAKPACCNRKTFPDYTFQEIWLVCRYYLRYPIAYIKYMVSSMKDLRNV